MTIDSLRGQYRAMETEHLQELHQSGKLADWAYPVIEAELLERGAEVQGRPEDYERQQSSEPFLKSCWEGRKSLGAAFWLAYFFGYKAVFLGALLLHLGLKAIVPFTGDLYLIAGAAYLVFATTAVWRCSKNSKSLWMAWLARLTTVIYSSGIIYFIALSFIQRA